MVTRRQSAIFVADVVGYSRMMVDDELGTYERVKAILDELLPPVLKQFRGRVVKTTGDGVMLDFSQAVDAVECAASFQDAVAQSPTARFDDRSMQFRIGINLGDIIVEEDDIYGTPVNVAARLEGLSEPGGVAISGSTYWNVKDKTELQFEEMGFLNVKNIPFPIEVYRLTYGDGSRSDEAARPHDAPAPLKKVWSEGENHLPSIVVLPFENLSKDPDQDYFCDGFTQELTTDLAKFSNLAVISSNSAFSYKGRRPRVDQLRDELGVEYVVAGAVQRSGEAMRIHVQLDEVKSGRQVWADRFQGDVANLFDLQDEMVGRIVASLASKLTSFERERVARKETGNVNSYAAFLKGLHYMNEFLGAKESEETLRQCRLWLERAIEQDADYARPWGWLAFAEVQGWLHGWSGEEALETAETLARKAIALDPEDYDTHWALAGVLSNSGAFEQARSAYHKALDLNRNDADLHAEMAEMLSYAGDHLEAISRIKFAMHLNPHFPEWYRWVLGWCCYFMRDYDEALLELGKILHPSNEVLLIMAASHAQLAENHKQEGRAKQAETASEEAADYMARFLERRADWSLAKQKKLTRVRSAGDLMHWLDGLQLAGLPKFTT